MDISRARRAAALAAILWSAALAPARAVPPGFNIQGRLTDANGVNREGNYSIKFAIYDAATGGTALWTRTYPALTVRNGNFQTVIGDVSGQPMLSDVFAAGDSRHLEIQVLSGPGVSSPEVPLVPRQQLVSVPYAMRAQNAASTEALMSNSDATLTTSGQERIRITSAGNVGIGTSTPTAKLQVNGSLDVQGPLLSNGSQVMLWGGTWTRDGNTGQCRKVNPMTNACDCPAGFTTYVMADYMGEWTGSSFVHALLMGCRR